MEADVVVVVPKMDELVAACAVFETDIGTASGRLFGSKPYYLTRVPGTEDSVAFVLINDQGAAPAARVTEEAVREFDPVLVFLLGTAVGREARVQLGSVVLSTKVFAAEEWVRAEGGGQLPRADQHNPPEGFLITANTFRMVKLNNKDITKDITAARIAIAQPEQFDMALFKAEPSVTDGFVASTNDLIMDPDSRERVFKLDDRIRCIDMESGGFAQVFDGRRSPAWMVIRGISDYGTAETKQEGFRMPAAAAAASFLKRFLTGGLDEFHPSRLRLNESKRSALSADQFYAQFDAQGWMKQRILKQLGVDLTARELGRHLTLDDFATFCVASGATPDEASSVCASLREQYFEEKYLKYTYQDDLRGTISNWFDDLERILRDNPLNLDLRNATVADVGIGNGLEAGPLLSAGVGSLIGVDVSKAMLEAAKARHAAITTVHAAAERLVKIPTGSLDVYLSLRTYMSRFFDIDAALREAYRVLKPSGAIVISIANGYVDIVDGRKTVIRGLTVPGNPGGARLVDHEEPRRIAMQVANKLDELGFSNVSFAGETTDIYVWADRDPRRSSM